MKIGTVVDRDQWAFFRSVYEDLARYHQVENLQVRQVQWAFVGGRINRALLQHDLRSFLKRNDLVFFEWLGEMLVRATQMPKTIPIVTRLHSFELYIYGPDIAWEKVDKVILVSQAMKRRFLEQVPGYGGQTAVIYLGVPLDTFRPGLKTFEGCLGMLGSVLPVKRIYEVILALYQLRKRGYPLTLRVAGAEPKWGDPAYPVRLREMVAELDLQEAVTFDGYVDAARWLQEIDILVSNSFWESQHLAMLEAMASGRYCLCHRWPGAEELVPAECLYVTEADFMSKVAAYCDMAETERQAWQDRMRAIAEEKFDLERHKREMRAAIEQVYCTPRY